jgi:hypothetical protein
MWLLVHVLHFENRANAESRSGGGEWPRCRRRRVESATHR